MRHRSSLTLLLLAAACGRPSTPPATAPSASDSAAAVEEPAQEQAAAVSETEEEAEEATSELPKRCAKKDGDVCTPGKEFVNRLCQGNYPSVALALFRKGSPWTRGYLTRKTQAWNASGGASDAGELAFDEEVIVLRHRAPPKGGMQVSGAGGGFDALRWNGSCVTLAKEELTLRSPPRAKHAKVEWRYLDEEIREAMRQDEKLNNAYRAQRKECKGATMGTVSDKCVKADVALSDAIVQYVRDGGTIPKPAKLP